MSKNIVLILVALMCASLTGCVSMGGPGIVFTQESHQENWISFYSFDPRHGNSKISLISNVSMSGDFHNMVIDPINHANRVYYEKGDSNLYRSYEDFARNIQPEKYFKYFKFPRNVRQIFVDWSSNETNDRWRKDHFISFLDDQGQIWTVDNKIEMAQRLWDNIVIPPDATSIYILFNNPEYPVMYKLNGKPVRVNARTGEQQVFLDVVLENMIVDETNGDVYDIRKGNFIRYNNQGQEVYLTNFVGSEHIVFPKIVKGVLYFGFNKEETVRTNGKALF